MAIQLSNFEKDWGEAGAQLSGYEVQMLLKEWFQTLLDTCNRILGDENQENQALSSLRALKDKIDAFLGEGNSPKDKIQYDTLVDFYNKCKELEIEKYIKSMTGSNTVTSTESLPIDKQLVVCTIDSSSSFSLKSSMDNGDILHVIIINTSDSPVVVTLPNAGGYSCLVEQALEIEAKDTAEVNVISDGTTMYIRAI